MGEVAQLQHARSDRALAAALRTRQAVKPQNNRNSRAIFERALAHIGAEKTGYLISPAHSPAWAMDYHGKTYIILSGSSDAHFRDGIRALGEYLWKSVSGDPLHAQAFGRVFRSILLFG